MNIINSNQRVWTCIKGYNGYEFSNDGLLRSMKNYKVNPYGKLIKKYYNKKENRYYFFMSNSNNERCKVYLDEIIDIINNDPNPIRRGEYDTDISSRNVVLTKRSSQHERFKSSLQRDIGIPKFTIINQEQPKSKIKPLIFY